MREIKIEILGKPTTKKDRDLVVDGHTHRRKPKTMRGT